MPINLCMYSGHISFKQSQWQLFVLITGNSILINNLLGEMVSDNNYGASKFKVIELTIMVHYQPAFLPYKIFPIIMLQYHVMYAIDLI